MFGQARGRELRLEQALEAASVGAWLYDLQSEELIWEGPMYQIFGVPLGTPMTFADFVARVHPDDRAQLEAGIAKTAEGPDFDAEYRITTRRGERWVLVRAQLRTDGRRRLITGVVFDITARKEAESRLAAKNVELERALAQLREARTELELSQRLAALGRLVAGVSHEMNTPLGALRSALDTIGTVAGRLDELELPNEQRRLPRALKASADAARTAGDRLTEVVSSLRSFSRLDRAPEERGRLEDCVHTVLSLVQGRAHDVTICASCDSPTPQVNLRAREVQQALLTIVLNAVEAVQRRGQGEVRVRTEVDDGEVRVVVEDDGDGLTPEQIEQLLEPGFTGSGPKVGLRLGLPIAHRVATEHRGALVLTSEGPDQGTRAAFSVAR